MMVSRAESAFNPDGTLADPKAEEQLRKFVAGFVAFAGARERLRLCGLARVLKGAAFGALLPRHARA